MASYLDFDGKYNPDLRFVISNWTSEDFKSFWDGKPISIKAGDMYECEHAIAYKLTKEIVDREMFRKAEEEYRSAGDNKLIAEKLRERGEMAILSKDLRKPYEDKTITLIKPGEENPIMARIREEIRAEEKAKLEGGISNEKAVSHINTDIPSDNGKPVKVETAKEKKARTNKKEGEFAE